MYKIIFAAAPLAAVLLTNVAHAAVTADLRVIGRIVPASCTMDLSQANVNYGTIALDRISATAPTYITPSMSGTNPRTTLTIACDAPAQIAVNLTDNKIATVDNSVAGAIGVGGAAITETFGIGVDSQGTRIGAFSMEGDGALVDTVAGKLIQSYDDGLSWTVPTSNSVQNTIGWLASWTKAGSPDTPEPVQNVSQVLELQAAVVPSDTLDTSVPVNLDGSVTMELVYL